MKLTLKSLQTEMGESFDRMSVRIDNFDMNVNERVDRILLRLDTHIKESNSNFREINQCFEQIDQRFDKMELYFHDEMQRNFRKFTSDIAASFSSYVLNLDDYIVKQEKTLNNHEDRITALERQN